MLDQLVLDFIKGKIKKYLCYNFTPRDTTSQQKKSASVDNSKLFLKNNLEKTIKYYFFPADKQRKNSQSKLWRPTRRKSSPTKLQSNFVQKKSRVTKSPRQF